MIKFEVRNWSEVWKKDGAETTLWAIASSQRRAYLLSTFANTYVEMNNGEDDE